MKFFLAVVVAVALLASTEAAKKKKKTKVVKTQVHKVPCGEYTTTLPLTQKGDYVSFVEGLTATGAKAAVGYAMIQRSVQPTYTYFEANLFTDFSDDLVNSSIVTTLTCAEISSLASTLSPTAVANYSASILDLGNVMYQHLFNALPYSMPINTTDYNYLTVTIPPTDGYRSGLNFGQTGTDSTIHNYLATLDAVSAVLVSGDYLVGCADLIAVECAAPKATKKAKKEETTKKAKKEETTKKAKEEETTKKAKEEETTKKAKVTTAATTAAKTTKKKATSN